MAFIEADMTIAHILTTYPETRELFIVNGFPQFADEEVVKELGAVLRLKTALKSRNLNEETFIRLLEEKAGEKERYRRLEPVSRERGGRLNLLALLPCPLKIPLQEELQVLLARLRREKGIALNYSIDTTANKYIYYEEYIPYFEDPEEIPDVILTTGYEFLHEKFIDTFIRPGYFVSAKGQEANERMRAAGMLDPRGEFFVLAVNALVMVVRMDRLNGRPVPRIWRDLLDPVYEKQVVMRGHDDIYCDALQLYYHKDFGDEGIRALSRAVRYGLHPAQMVKEIMSAGPDLPSIYIMPRFFAETITNQRNISILWPEDGALVYPISLLVKAGKEEELGALTEYLTGAQAARIFDDAFFPALHPEAGAGLPAGAGFKWLGWDYIRNCSVETLQQELNEKFLRAREGETTCNS